MLLTRHLSIQSKLILVLLFVSLGSMLGIGVIGYRSGRDALARSVTNQLTSLRVTKADQVLTRMGHIRNQLITLSEDRMFVEAMKDFLAGFKKLQGESVKPEQKAKLDEFYKTEFLPALEPHLEGKPFLQVFLPRTPAGIYLQFQYLANNPDPYVDKEHLDDPGDGSEYTKAHRKYHPLIRNVGDRFGYEDILLIDPTSGSVVYSVQKMTDFATDLLDGPYSQSNLSKLVRELRNAKDINAIQFCGYQQFRPHLNRAAAFVGSPIADNGQVIGLLVFQLAVDEMSRVLAGDMAWKEEGLGDTGEVILVSQEHRMLNRSRFHWEDTEGYLATLAKAGYPKRQIDEIERSETTIICQEDRSAAVERALAGQKATDIVTDYRGIKVLASFMPIEFEGQKWAIVAKQDLSEAFRPIDDFARLVGITAGTLTLLVSLLAVILSAFFVRPIHRLIEGARQVSKGELDLRVEVASGDELRELADSFNEMTTSLKLKSALADQKALEHEQLLLNVLPAPAAARFKEGESQISDSHADVTVLFAEVVDFLRLTQTMPAEQAVGLLNDLVIAFDEAAERHGVEKVKTLGSSYMAACGLMTHRVDHTLRMVEFARDLLRIVRHFNQERNTQLGMVISIHSGPVVGGIVGRTRFIYDLWGDTVNVAHAIQGNRNVNSIRVTDAVHDRLGDQVTFGDTEEVIVPAKGTFRVWTLVPG